MFTAGMKVGPYGIQSVLGSGGMGEVYRARDSKLGRDIALKILPATFVHDPERVARFQREAQILAALNHPHIAAIYGLEEAEGSRFLVLELVAGETLAQKLGHGSTPADPVVSGFSRTHGGLPVNEALSIARQIADALQAAHEKGIIHRDLKPANIAFTSDSRSVQPRRQARCIPRRQSAGRWRFARALARGRPRVEAVGHDTVHREERGAFTRWQISSGGSQPLWSRSGRELFYVNADRSPIRLKPECGSG